MLLKDYDHGKLGQLCISPCIPANYTQLVYSNDIDIFWMTARSAFNQFCVIYSIYSMAPSVMKQKPPFLKNQSILLWIYIQNSVAFSSHWIAFDSMTNVRLRVTNCDSAIAVDCQSRTRTTYVHRKRYRREKQNRLKQDGWNVDLLGKRSMLYTHPGRYIIW